MQTKSMVNKKAKPFLKWAGGKKQLLDSIEKNLPLEIKNTGVIDKYFEPFLGGGAVFFYLFNNYEIKEAYLYDINKELILTYNVIKNHPKKLISNLKVLANEYLPLSDESRKEYYYNVRREFNGNLENFDYLNFSNEHILRASQMIFLNKTCFNGLYRVNKCGKFNVPMGRYKNPLICDETNILKVSNVLKNVCIVCDDYSVSEELIDNNSFIYLDPPYFPIKQNSFTKYNSDDFGVYEQIELSKFCKKIDDMDGKFLLSNSDPKNIDSTLDFFEKTYNNLNLKNFSFKRIDAKRSINSDGGKRGSVKELLIYNY